MSRRKPYFGLAAAACVAALSVAACSSGSSSSTPASGTSAGNSSSASLPTVTMMVGGINKQIYLPYQLAQSL
ncbi:MAG: hypothetical protein ACRDP7_18210, partial [Trebonia sp.]